MLQRRHFPSGFTAGADATESQESLILPFRRAGWPSSSTGLFPVDARSYRKSKYFRLFAMHPLVSLDANHGIADFMRELQKASPV